MIIVDVLCNWYSKLRYAVRRNGELSAQLIVCSGVRHAVDLHTPNLTVSFRMILSGLEWLSQIFNDVKRRAVSLWQLSFLFYIYFIMYVLSVPLASVSSTYRRSPGLGWQGCSLMPLLHPSSGDCYTTAAHNIIVKVSTSFHKATSGTVDTEALLLHK